MSGTGPRERRKVGSESRSEDSLRLSIGSARDRAATVDSNLTRQQLFNSRFRQQKLRARYTVMRPFFVITGCLVTGVLMTALGAAMLVASQGVFQHEQDYTNCDQDQPACGSNDDGPLVTPCECLLNFTVPEGGIKGPVFFYYGLSNYNQNLRRYVLGKDDSQLLGSSGELYLEQASSQPFFTLPTFQGSTDNFTRILPSGALPNSYFNDSFILLWQDPNESNKRVPVNLTRKGIAWTSDLNGKFDNPDNLSLDSQKYGKPPYWEKPVAETLGKEGFKNEDLIVWMRVAGLPTFRKLWRVTDPAANSGTLFKDGGLREGLYTVRLIYNYPTRAIHAKKRFIVSTTSWMGGRNSFLGTAYIVTGIICALSGLGFLALHLKFGKSWDQLSNLNDASANGVRKHGYI